VSLVPALWRRRERFRLGDSATQIGGTNRLSQCCPIGSATGRPSAREAVALAGL